MEILGVDFFCAAGGATKGFQNAGIKVLRGIDKDLTCKETYETNCSPSKFLLKDIDDLKPCEVMEGFKSQKMTAFFLLHVPHVSRFRDL